ncbi:MAG TPA: hypothetical protein VMF11_11515 [Candidatus Baltobacteraceae bacterium]|nr:hypothetical protein [Candidatus Baltobacteraceae bacterium]
MYAFSGAVLFAAVTATATPFALPVLLRPTIPTGATVKEAYGVRLQLSGGAFRQFTGKISVTALEQDDASMKLHAVFDLPGHSTSTDMTVNKYDLSAAGKSAIGDPGVEVFYDPIFCGRPSGTLQAGEAWRFTIARPWAFGPAGEQRVRVVSIDAQTGEVRLELSGSGNGPSGQEIEHPIHTTGSVNGTTIDIPTEYGASTWHATLTLEHGVTADETLTVDQQVFLGQTTISSARQEMRRIIITLHRLN